MDAECTHVCAHTHTHTYLNVRNEMLPLYDYIPGIQFLNQKIKENVTKKIWFIQWKGEKKKTWYSNRQHKVAGTKPQMSVNVINVHGLKS